MDEIVAISEIDASSDMEERAGATPKATKSKFDQFFTKEKEQGICKLCRDQGKAVVIQMKNRNTSGLRKHLFYHHKKYYFQLFPDKETHKSKEISQFFQSSAPSSKSNFDFETATVDWVVKKCLPFSFFEDKATKNYFKLISPQHDFPKRLTLKRQIEGRFLKQQATLKAYFEKLSSKVSFTIDGWTSIAGKTYYGITAHFIDCNWNYHSIVLDFVPCYGDHTGKKIAEIFYNSITSFKLENKLMGITVDNASANTRFMVELQNLMPNFNPVDQHFRCFGHILNLGTLILINFTEKVEKGNNSGVQDLLTTLKLNSNFCENSLPDSSDSESEVDNFPGGEFGENDTLITKIRSIFKKIKGSEAMKVKFSLACQTVGIESAISPILDCKTRWNSTHDMMGAALKLRDGLRLFCSSDSSLTKFQITEEQFNLLERVYKFLSNFKNLSVKLSGEKYVTLPLVIVYFNLLIDKIEAIIKGMENGDFDEHTYDLINAYQAARDKILKHYKKTNWIYCTTLVLDPRHKVETFDMTEWGREIKTRTVNKFNDIYHEYLLTQPTVIPEAPFSLNEQNEEDNFADLVDFNVLYKKKTTEETFSELDSYLAAGRLRHDENGSDILKWWAANAAQFPVLAQMAKDFLAIPATSVPAERLFSRASFVINKYRNRLNNQSAKMLLCLNSWAGNQIFY